MHKLLFILFGLIAPVITFAQDYDPIGRADFEPTGAISGAFFGGLFGSLFALYVLVFIILIVSAWKVYSKAGKPGWAAIIPVYNAFVMLQIVGKPIWWIILLFIPFVNVIVGLIVTYHLALAFGKGVGFACGLIFLPFIFYPILAFGNSQYIGVSVTTAAPTPNSYPPVTPTSPPPGPMV